MNTADFTEALRYSTPSLRDRVNGIIEIVSNAFEIPAGAFWEHTRVIRVAEPRQVAMALIREHSNLSLADVGMLFRMDHTTVIHAIKAVRRKRSTNAHFDSQIAEISRQVRHRFPA